MSIIFISHKLHEVLEIADRITVLRRGKKVETLPAAGATEAELARLMVGRDVLLRIEKTPSVPKEPLLAVVDLHVLDERELEAVRGVSFEVRAGEIVGIAGVDGNGQTELVEALTGLRKIESGSFSIGGRDLTGASTKSHPRPGVGHIPEDRQRRGLVLEFTLAENMALHDFDRPPNSRFGWLRPGQPHRTCRELLEEFDVRGGGPKTPARSLSGGNQQKVVIAREVGNDPRVLIAAQPTRGLDVGAIEYVHRRLVEERDEGRAVLLVSLELDEVLSLSDRILAMYEGADRRRVRAGRDRGGARHRDARAARRPRKRRHERRADRPPARTAEGEPGTAAARLDRWQRAGSWVAPVLTAVLAFLAGGLVVLATGHNPIKVYQGIWTGTGLEWFYQVGSYEVGLPFSDAKVWFPWNVNDFDSLAATNLQQTLILWTTLVLTGLAVAFAFRCGLFNIGGQGQYFVGAYFAIWIGSSFSELNSFVHVAFAIVAAALAGAAWAGIAGILKATVGAHEVITTIMLNWIAYFVGLYLFSQGGPLQNTEQVFSPTSNAVVEGAKLPVFWGEPGPPRAPRRTVHRLRRPRRVLGDHQPDDARLRGARRRLQSRGRTLRRHLRGAQLLPRDGHLGRLRRPRRRGGHARLALFDRVLGHPVVPHRLHGHRRRTTRS